LRVPETSLKLVHWVASSRKDLRTFPEAVQRAMGYALFRAQDGKKASSAKPWRGLVKGAGVLEIVEDHDTNTFRVLYTVRFAGAVYVLHAFQKKSKKGIATPRHEVELIRARYELAKEHYEQWRKEQ
jgi:phage-related protein